MKPTADVPCNDCTACCRNEAVPLVEGDNPENYGDNLVQVGGVTMLKTNERGECIFLAHGGCSIHEKRPIHCRAFDCRLLYLQYANLSRHDRRAIRKKYGVGVGPVMAAGRDRVHTLST